MKNLRIVFALIIASISLPFLSDVPSNASIYSDPCYVGESLLLGVKGSDPKCQVFIDQHRANERWSLGSGMFKFAISAVAVIFIIIIIRKEKAEPRMINFVNSNISKIGTRYIYFVIMTFGGILIILPILMPNIEILAAVTRANGNYLTAVSLSEFIGVRYGVIITLGIILFAIGFLLLRSAKTKSVN
jgi:hypothetical protein